MTQHKHIYKTPNHTYAVRIERKINSERFSVSETYLTLEEAIAARDTILRNFEASKKLQHSKDKQARRLARAIERFGTEDIVEIKANGVSDRTLFVKRAECEICGTDISRSHYFMNSSKCSKCNLKKKVQSFNVKCDRVGLIALKLIKITTLSESKISLTIEIIRDIV